MKALNTVLKVLTALATIAGAVYIVATYGEQIVAWARKMLAALPKCPCCTEPDEVAQEEAAPAAEPEEEAAPAAEEAPAAQAPAEEEPAPEVVVAENEPVAEETDFAE